MSAPAVARFWRFDIRDQIHQAEQAEHDLGRRQALERHGDKAYHTVGKPQEKMTCAVLRAAALFSAVGMTSMLSAQSDASRDVLPFRATETTLANGLKVIVVPTGFPNLVSIQIPVQTGSRNEVEPGKSGFAHFFEHLMFRGTPANPPERYRQIMAKAGARDNASTGDDSTRST